MKKIINNVPYYNQRELWEGESQCFTASSAMLVSHINPVINIQDYYQRREQYGGSVFATSHLGALKSFGYNPVYTTDLTIEQAKELLDNDIPVAVGWLHYGHVSSPDGFGHWSVLYGYDETGWYVRDPYGDPNLALGGWVNPNQPGLYYGRSLKYSYLNFNPRWQVEGNGTGYALYIPG